MLKLNFLYNNGLKLLKNKSNFYQLFHQNIISSYFRNYTRKTNAIHATESKQYSFLKKYLIKFTVLIPVLFLQHKSAFVFANELSSSTFLRVSSTQKNQQEVSNDILRLINEAKTVIEDDQDYVCAKSILKMALDLAEQNQLYEHVSFIFNLFVVIAVQDGTILEVEQLLVRFIENLMQMGYDDKHNAIIQFQLKLSRLYQLVGNQEMAEIGFRNCISMQEEKLHSNKKLRNKKFDEKNNGNNHPGKTVADLDDDIKTTCRLYACTLFWYGRFLTEQEDYDKAKIYMKKCLKYNDEYTDLVTVSQKMVVHYHTAEVLFHLKEYEEATYLLLKAIQLAKDNIEQNPDLPHYFTKLGIIYMIRGIYDSAKMWCEYGNRFAKIFNNELAEEESNFCLDKLKEIQWSSYKKK